MALLGPWILNVRMLFVSVRLLIGNELGLALVLIWNKLVVLAKSQSVAVTVTVARVFGVEPVISSVLVLPAPRIEQLALGSLLVVVSSRLLAGVRSSLMVNEMDCANPAVSCWFGMADSTGG